MKFYSKSIIAALLLMSVLSCRDESLNPIPDWEPGVRGWGRISGGGFKMGDLNQSNTIKFRWISHDGKITINKAEFYIFFTETYKDIDGNFPEVNHLGAYGGGEGGKLLKSLEGGALPANDVDAEFTVSPTEVYNALKDLEYDYKGDPQYGKVKVFENPERTIRTAAAPFIVDGKTADNFLLSWKLYSTDGKVYDSFGDGVCAGELPLANCYVTWSVSK